MAATRLRKTFQYPDSSSDEDAVEEGMDYQDRTTLLTTLQTHDTRTTSLYTKLLLVFPASLFLLTLPGLLSTHSFLPTLLALASLAGSAYALYFLPLGMRRVGILEGQDTQGGGRGKGKGRSGAVGGYGLNTTTNAIAPQAQRPNVPFLPEKAQDLLAQWIVPVNAAVCVGLAVLELVRGRAWREGVMVGGGYMPGLVLGVVVWARRELRVLDLGELEGLKGGSG